MTARDIPKSKSKKEKGRPNDHYTILLSTTLPDRKPVVIRRHDGFEKRLLLRYGRCRVAMGYLLDEMRLISRPAPLVEADRSNTDVGGGDREGPSVVYVLPQSLVRTVTEAVICLSMTANGKLGCSHAGDQGQL
ncbi:hypothetical protein Egran_04372 [Elaphomyces granulatus]|uniref:Uncharacterized protein n=1 Tax=Elaphomyces granulatus TaxID=519963 RepID=A0A232LUV8_9EURO|nr:hypothetical protein Egran_04372 [Elaphomyces granulatus]